MLKKHKIDLKNFRVRSFVTSMDVGPSTMLKGGSFSVGTCDQTQVGCPTRESECYPNNQNP